MRYRNTRTGTVIHVSHTQARTLGSDWATTLVSNPPEPAEPQRPANADAKAAWVAYIAATTDLTETEAAELTKAGLIDLAQ
ncbi:hypothetical protein CDO52_00205 [Nocardiopsis gilva YIM 90087]|uniref:Uncharacterized protein n=1 Tax=Nocardiopsis gilva YIM 90087 TaxID=1235441 RepID=A0A223RZV2_9ACTN|nr:hypothetical protein [Nocardiopsis gilva]ASU81410.1 hypothetical protein CDO52_00205 [Nocardiopsis gilva YIM 90087]